MFVSIGDDISSRECIKSDLHISLFIGIGTGAIILLIMIVSIMIIVVLIRGKARLKRELNNLMENTKTIYYEEIKPANNYFPPSPTLNTQENSAYGVRTQR